MALGRWNVIFKQVCHVVHNLVELSAYIYVRSILYPTNVHSIYFLNPLFSSTDVIFLPLTRAWGAKGCDEAGWGRPSRNPRRARAYYSEKNELSQVLNIRPNIYMCNV